jgi:hypothetical protein
MPAVFHRSTVELVVLIFATLIAATVFVGVLTVAILQLRGIDMPAGTFGAVNGNVGTIIGATLGLIAGQAAGRRRTEDERNRIG